MALPESGHPLDACFPHERAAVVRPFEFGPAKTRETDETDSTWQRKSPREELLGVKGRERGILAFLDLNAMLFARVLAALGTTVRLRACLR
jgi:hypothetical protein